MSLFKKLFGKKHKEEGQLIQEVTQEIQSELLEETVQEVENQEESIETIVPAVIETEITTSEIAENMAEETLIEDMQQEEQKEENAQSVCIKTENEEETSEETEGQVEELVEKTLEEKIELEETLEPSKVEEEVAQEESLKENSVQEETPQTPQKQGFIKRLFSGLSKTRDSILKGVDDVLSNFKRIDEDLYEELEEALIMADFGVDTTLHIMEKLKAKVKEDRITDPSGLKPALQAIITNFLTEQPVGDVLNENGPTVILVIGVNGVGKTTSIGKMSHLFKSQGKKVLVAAADTFRAAAIEQLNVWTERAGVEIIKHEEGSDAAAVVFDGIAAAKSRKSDVLICDTAGRLQNKTNLMKELEKISRIIAREYPEAKKEILIVIDATTGQNALQQVKLFKEVADINGIILTKLDGTAKGGAIVGIYESLKVPVKYIGVGEKMDDLQPFDANAFAKALFEEEA